MRRRTTLIADITVDVDGFDAGLRALVDKVERTGVTVVVTRRGRPIAQLVQIADLEPRRDTRGSVQLLVPEDEAYYGSGEAWDSDRAS